MLSLEAAYRGMQGGWCQVVAVVGCLHMVKVIWWQEVMIHWWQEIAHWCQQMLVQKRQGVVAEEVPEDNFQIELIQEFQVEDSKMSSQVFSKLGFVRG